MQIDLLNTLRKSFWTWIDNKRPGSSVHSLNQKTLFIFPSRQGVWFLALDLLLWLLGTNYENNLVLSLAFLLITLFIVTILHTFTNLAGVKIELIGCPPVFSGELAEIKIAIKKTGKRTRENILFRWGSGAPTVIDFVDDDELQIAVVVETDKRGWCDPGKLIVESFYPLGIMRCWARLNCKARVLVYPKPIPAGPLPNAAVISDEGTISHHVGSDEFGGYRSYQAGDSLKNLSWKHYARGMDVMTKEYTAYVDQRLWLEWDYLAGMDTESRLSRLCFWVLEAAKLEREYGVRLPHSEIKPAIGKAHRDRVLRELALFGQDRGQNETVPQRESGNL